MIWESEISENTFGNILPFKGILQPALVMNLYPALTILFVTVLLPLYVYSRIWDWWPEFSARSVLVLAASYSVLSFVVGAHVLIATYFRVRGPAQKFVEKAWQKS